jgi:hypothetical protein
MLRFLAAPRLALELNPGICDGFYQDAAYGTIKLKYL